MRFSDDNLGISTNIYVNPADVIGMITAFSEKFSCIEIEIESEFRTVYDKGGEELDRVIESLKSMKSEFGLRYTVHAPYIGQSCDIAAKDDAIRHQAVAYLNKCLEFCAAIGATKMTYHPGLIDPMENGLVPQIERLIDSATAIATKARSLGIVPCLENMGDSRPKFLLLNHDQHEAVCRASGTKLTIDLNHHASLLPQGADGADELYYELFFSSLKRILPYVAHFHIADIDGIRHVHLPLGKGRLDIQRVLSFIASNGYDGPVIVEERGGGYSAEEFVNQAVHFRQMIQQAA